MRLPLIILPMLIAVALFCGYAIISGVRIATSTPYFSNLEGMPFVSR